MTERYRCGAQWIGTTCAPGAYAMVKGKGAPKPWRVWAPRRESVYAEVDPMRNCRTICAVLASVIALAHLGVRSRASAFLPLAQ